MNSHWVFWQYNDPKHIAKPTPNSSPDTTFTLFFPVWPSAPELSPTGKLRMIKIDCVMKNGHRSLSLYTQTVLIATVPNILPSVFFFYPKNNSTQTNYCCIINTLMLIRWAFMKTCRRIYILLHHSYNTYLCAKDRKSTTQISTFKHIRTMKLLYKVRFHSILTTLRNHQYIRSNFRINILPEDIKSPTTTV